MSTPSAKALAAAAEIQLGSHLQTMFHVAEIIDRHMAPEYKIRYFRSGLYGDTWEWDGKKMFNTYAGDESQFPSPESLLACPEVYETDEHGNRLEGGAL